jgi:hypothetical protein
MKIHHLIRIFALFTLACATLFLTACGQTAEEKDTGPNANLSNEELLKKAVANMSALSSFHMEVEKQVDGLAGMTMTDMEQMGFSGPPYYQVSATVDLEKSTNAKSGIKQMVIKYTSLSLDPKENLDWNIIVTADNWFESTDGGKSWSISDSEGPGFLAASLLNEWSWDKESISQIDKALDNGLVLKDGSPRTETLDGVSTRHMVPDMESIKDTDEPPFPKEIQFWVSTDSLPTVRQIRSEGTLPPASMTPTPGSKKGSEEHEALSFKYTWKWSRFNEDFADVNPPPLAPTATVIVK